MIIEEPQVVFIRERESERERDRVSVSERSIIIIDGPFQLSILLHCFDFVFLVFILQNDEAPRSRLLDTAVLLAYVS